MTAEGVRNLPQTKMKQGGVSASVPLPSETWTMTLTRFSIGPTMTIKAATDSVAETQSVFQTLDAPSPTERTRITDAMKHY